MLKAGIVWNEEHSISDEGTPQGGVISPMLANVALTCLDEEVYNKFGSRRTNRRTNPIIRYADDFIIVARSKREATAIKSYIKDFLKPKVGVELSDEKTHITNISDGFDFLGFNFRKYHDTLLIKPQREKVQEFKWKLKHTIRIFSDKPAHVLISKLNPIINGWGNYYRHVAAKRTFVKLCRAVWINTRQWVIGKHPRQRRRAFERYYTDMGNRRWIFHDEESKVALAQIDKIPIKRFIKVHRDRRVYNMRDKEYWKIREYTNAKNSIYGSPVMTRLFRRQHGKCDYCGNLMTDEHIKSTEIHRHHMKPRSEGGDDRLGNLRLLHLDCHNSLHVSIPRKDMARYMDNRIDYLRILKPQS
jgi:RNA-directed DNA polymerase